MNRTVLKIANIEKDQEKRVDRDQQIKAIRNEVGWVYDDLSWFSDEEAEMAREQRSKFLKALSGWISYGFQDSKLHSGTLSPGCSICGNGGWDCNYINHRCSRNCFYCPQDRSIKEESESKSEGFAFKSPSEHISYMRTFQIRGVGFSGGEPFLVLDKLLAHIAAIRREFGNSIYLWAYTNGDFVDIESLEKLKEIGLNEIRFDLSARNYDLTPIILSKEYIPTVTVEVPAIPEDYDLMKVLLSEMEKIGVNFLNLHQLATTQFNYKSFVRRGYHFLHIPRIPIFESEICALKLLEHAKQHRINLPINYCCQVYKNRFQGRDIRARTSRLVKDGFEELRAGEITNAGYIRLFKVLDSTEKIDRLAKILEENHCPPDLWQCNEKRTEIAIHSSLFPHVDWSNYELSVFYFESQVGLKDENAGVIEKNTVPKNKLVHFAIGWSKTAIEGWSKLYVQGMSYKDVSRYFAKNYPIEDDPTNDKGKETLSKLQKEIYELRKCAKWEEMENGLSEVF